MALIFLFGENEGMRSKPGIKQGRGTGQSNSKSKKNTRREKKYTYKKIFLVKTKKSMAYPNARRKRINTG